LDDRCNDKDWKFRRSDTPTHRDSNSRRGTQNQKSRPTTPFKSTQRTEILPSMSNASVTSAYLSSNGEQGPMKYRSIRNESEKGFEIFISDRTTSKMVSNSTNDKQIVNRTALSQRIQQQKKSIKQIRKDLNVTTDHRWDANTSNTETVPFSTTATRRKESQSGKIGSATPKNSLNIHS
jgi:hypothetical protein